MANLNLNIAKLSPGVAAQSVEFVDLSAKPAIAKIVRGGFDVPSVTVDPRRVDQLIGGLAGTPSKELPRVVSQSVASGTKVPAGTVVDLVLTSRSRIPFDILTNLHADLANKNMDALDDLLGNQAIKKALLTYDSPDQVTAADKTLLTNAFTNAGINVTANDPQRTFDLAFDSARQAMAFQG